MPQPPAYLQPLIGYAIQQLGRQGWTSETVAEQMLRIAPERGWLREHVLPAIEWALDFRRATDEAQTSGYEKAVADLWQPPLPERGWTGVRVVLSIQPRTPNAPCPRDTASVVLNVSPEMTPADAVNAAIQLWNNQQTNPAHGSDVYCQAVSGGVVSVYRGGFEGGIEVVKGL